MIKKASEEQGTQTSPPPKPIVHDLNKVYLTRIAHSGVQTEISGKVVADLSSYETIENPSAITISDEDSEC